MQEAVSRTVNLYDAKTNLSDLVERAAEGEEIIIAKNGKPCARLLALPEQREPRQPGGWEGQIWCADDWEETPQELIDAFEADDPLLRIRPESEKPSE
jgi:prevent-host-death family protein